jgi:hypothetical protein
MLFDRNGLIKHYPSAEGIIADFYELRLDFYERRRTALLKVRCPSRPRARASSTGGWGWRGGTGALGVQEPCGRSSPPPRPPPHMPHHVRTPACTQTAMFELLRLNNKVGRIEMLDSALSTEPQHGTPGTLGAHCAQTLCARGLSPAHLTRNNPHQPPPSTYLQVRFIEAVVSGSLKISNRKRAEVEAELQAKGFDRMPGGKNSGKVRALRVGPGGGQGGSGWWA